MSRVSEESTTVDQTAWEDFTLIPDDYFIFKTLELSKKPSSKKIFHLIFSLLNDDSPFPVDQLMWGYLPINYQKTHWVYFMGLKERLQKLIGNPPYEKHLLPCAALGILSAKTNEICTFTCNGITSVLVQKKPSSCVKTSNSLLPSPANNLESSLPKRHLFLTSIQKTRHHHYRCCLSEQQGDTIAQTSTVILPRKLIWQADIRDKDQIQQLKKQEHAVHILQRSTKGCLCGLGIVLLFQVFLWIGQLVLSHKKSTYESLIPLAQKIENKDRLVQKIQTVWEQEISSFELLGLINTVRPDGIYFTQATIEQAHRLVVEAVAENTTLIHTYVKDLQKSRYFSSVQTSEVKPFGQGTKFRLSCNFKNQKQSSFLTIQRP